MHVRTYGTGVSYTTEDYLNSSLQTYRWLSRQRIEEANGISYRINPGGAVDVTGGPVFGKYSLYSGSAGIGIFLLRLYDAIGDVSYLDEARLVASQLMADTPDGAFYRDKYKTAPKSTLKVTGWQIGVYTGLAGEGIFSLELYRKTKERQYLDFAIRLADDLLDVAQDGEGGLTWSGDLDVFSDGGFILYFLSVYEETKDARYLEAARKTASYIHKKAIKASQDGQEGIYWKANELALVGMPKDSIYPGFSHGTSGIAYAFACLYEADGQSWELDDAKWAAQFLTQIADETDAGGVLIPYLYGGEAGNEWKHKHYIGFCHGPAGTALLFQKLYDLTKENAYRDFMERLSRGIVDSGAPLLNSWGFWNNYCLCCGSPGLIEHFVHMYEYTGKESYLELAWQSAARVITDARVNVQGHRCWYGHWDRTNPRDVQTYTGLYVGAAGAAAALLRLYCHLEGRECTRIFEYQYL